MLSAALAADVRVERTAEAPRAGGAGDRGGRESVAVLTRGVSD
jgi:hypothetical protein